MLNQDFTAVKHVQRFSVHCNLSVGSDETDLALQVKQPSWIVRVALRI